MSIVTSPGRAFRVNCFPHQTIPFGRSKKPKRCPSWKREASAPPSPDISKSSTYAAIIPVRWLLGVMRIQTARSHEFLAQDSSANSLASGKYQVLGASAKPQLPFSTFASHFGGVGIPGPDLFQKCTTPDSQKHLPSKRQLGHPH
jgi:hypothetical protein